MSLYSNRETLSYISELLVSNSKCELSNEWALSKIKKILNNKINNEYTPMQDKINKTRDYLDYIEKHYHNVQKAWRLVQNTCSDMKFISDDNIFNKLDKQIKNHDMSKLSHNEFVQYRMKFYPTKDENNCPTDELLADILFKDAWNNHKKDNPHHWQNWTSIQIVTEPYELQIHCVHMVVDWIAMSLEFGGTALEYYEDNISDIDIPEWADKLVREICKRVYGEGD